MKYNDEKDMQNFKKVNVDSWDSMKDSVYLRLINARYLSKYGDDIAHDIFLDLAIVYSVQEKSDDTLLSHLLTNEDIQRLNVEQKEVHDIACSNLLYDRKRRTLTFGENIMKENMMYPLARKLPNQQMGIGGQNGPTFGVIIDTEEDKDNVLVITSKSSFGAAGMALPQVLEDIYVRFGNENFYMLPVSIHQVWCVRAKYANKNNDKSLQETECDLLDLVEEFNDTQNKNWKNILSYKIYYYMGDDGKHIFPIK